MPAALAAVVRSVDCDLLVLSYNNESWLELDELEAMCSEGRREVATLAFDSTRYVGARIGIFDPSGRKVGRVSHLSNQELLVIAGKPALVRRVMEAVGSGAVPPGAPASAPVDVRGSLSGSVTGSVTGTVTGAASDAVSPSSSDQVAAGLVDRLQQAT